MPGTGWHPTEGERVLNRLRSSMRFRITALAAAAVALVLTFTAVALISVQRQQLTANLDSALVQRADDLTALLAFAEPQPTALGGADGDGFAQLVSTDGRVILASPNLSGVSAIPLGLDPGQTQAIRTVEGTPPDDDVFRLLSRRVDTVAGPAVLLLGASLDEVAENAGILAASLAVAIPLVVAMVAVVVWWLVGRTLAPVEGIRAEVAVIGSTELHRRVPEPTGDDEISRLAHTMNEMLDRLEDAVRRQQRFVADASHELRSPLTRMRAELEVDVARADTADLRATHESILEEVIGLQRLVDDLLQLARADAGVSSDRTERVDLDDLVLREARRVRANARVKVDISGVSAAQVVGDPNQLTRAVRNLVDNAERHAAGRIELTLAEVNGAALLTVSDDGPGIPADQRQRIFERFGRLDEARAQGTGGTGLGLAITRDIIEQHGGTITLDSSHQAGARLVVQLPTAS